MKPFYEEVVEEDGTIIRLFLPHINTTETWWHRDKEDRLVTIECDNDWKFQYDNILPMSLPEGTKLYIQKENFHRLIPGSTSLKIKIIKLWNT